MSRRIVVALAVAVVVAVVWFSRGEDNGLTTNQRTARAARARAAVDARRVDGRPVWFGQNNVGARRVAGIVLHDGAPVSGATVRLANALTMAGTIAPSVVTDAQGRFDFGPQLATSYVVVAEKPKLVGAVLAIDLRYPTPVTPHDDLRLVLHACTASLRGTIRDDAGGVIPSARVARASMGITTSAGVDADDKGAYELCVPVGESSVSVSADGYASELETVSAYGPLRRDFALAPEAIVVGRVVRADDKTPVGGALVELRSDEFRMLGAKLYASSDDTGAFRFSGASPGQHEVTASADGLASKPVYVIAEVANANEIVCELAATYSVSGKIVERGTKKAVAGIAVTLAAVDADPLRANDSYAVSQSDGTFVLESLFPNEYTPMLRLYEIIKPPAIVVANANVGGIVLEVDRAGSIAGRITHAGKPVEGTQISARAANRGRSTLTDHAGNYVLRDLGPGEYKLYAESKRAGAFANGPTITLAKGEHRTGADIDMNLAGSIAGVVVDQKGAPVAGVFLSFSLLRGRDFGMATTAEDGTFLATALSGGGEYVYEVRPDERSAFSYPAVDRKRHPPIAVRDGNTRVTGAVIKIRIDPQHSISGRVVDSAGKPVADASVLVLDARSNRAKRSDENGAFTIDGLAARPYELIARAGPRTGFASAVAVGRKDVEIRLLDPAAIDGTIEGFTTAPDITAIHSHSDRRYRVTPTNNAFQLRDIASGTYVVTATSASGFDSREITVAPGATTKLAMRQRAFGTIEGTLVDESNKPIADRRCICRLTDYLVLSPARYGTTDASGAFRCERVPPGDQYINCENGGKVVKIAEGETARVEIVVKPRAPRPAPRRAQSGLALEDQLDGVRVRAVEPRSPAERAGFLVGDVIEKLGDEAITSGESYRLLHEIESKAGTTKIAIERNDRELVLSLTIDAVP